MIFDTHAHYDDEAYDRDREQVLEQIRQGGVSLVADVGASLESTRKAIALSREYDFIYAVAGVHPSEVGELTPKDMEWLEQVSEEEKVVAIGEIGLDYHYPEPDREIQKHWFREQLKLAQKVQLPISIHSREAAKDTLDIIQELHGEKYGGVIHCFSYSWEMAKTYIDMGFYLGIGGVVTFKNAKKLKEVVANTPIEHIVLETDAPYLTPEPNRGKRNASHYLKYVAEAIGEIKGISPEEVIRITTENGLQMYHIDREI